jgi:hypothetical protein
MHLQLCILCCQYLRLVQTVSLKSSEVLTAARMAESSVADPGSGAFLTPGSGIRDEQRGSYFRELRDNFLV